MSEYPEHAKLERIKEASQLVGEFIDWARTKRYLSTKTSLQRMLEEFFEIDPNVLEAEKRAMLAQLREAAAARNG